MAGKSRQCACACARGILPCHNPQSRKDTMKKTTRNDVTRLSLASIRRVSGDELQQVTGGDGPSQPSQTAKGIIDSIGR
jgi:uncharacterized protein (DUF849 family)